RIVVFFVQADDGIRDFHVTGVQTCALPIYLLDASDPDEGMGLARKLRPDLILVELELPTGDGWVAQRLLKADVDTFLIPVVAARSEERRVGNESRARRERCYEEKMNKDKEL